MPTERKVQLRRALVATGVPRIEATAFISPRGAEPRDAASVADGHSLANSRRTSDAALAAVPAIAARVHKAGGVCR